MSIVVERIGPELATVGSGGKIVATSEPCGLHGSHAPFPTYCEVHHVVPRAWQMVWQPDAAPFPGRYDGQALWDARTVNACRTGHGNIHFWIVTLMHAWEPGVELAVLASRVRVAVHQRMGRSEYAVALQALGRFEEAGGDLGALVAAHQWGSI